MNVHVDELTMSSSMERKPGHTLPAEHYISQAAFETDLEVFFRRHWIFAGVAADIPEPGDVRTIEIGRTSVILLRDDDGVVRGFHNVCRHRGARLVNEKKTSVGRLVCPYHQWSYDLTGELAHANQMGKSFDRSCFGLKTVHVRDVAGLLMVCIAEDCPDDIAEFETAIAPRITRLDLANAKVAHETTIIEDGNWKLSVDNNRECYHCEGSHPELCETLNHLDVGFDPEEMSESTSGTTGLPKGVPVPLRAMLAFAAYMKYGIDLRDDDIFWNIADPCWAYGLYYAGKTGSARGRIAIRCWGNHSQQSLRLRNEGGYACA